jgi:large subunit ribosomal protein L19
MGLLETVEAKYLKKDIVDFGPGDTLKVHIKIKEGDKERIQIFTGTVIQRKGKGATQTFTVRKISAGIGVERIFPLHSPAVAKIEKLKEGKVKRAKLYYLRELKGKSAKIEERRRGLVEEGTEEKE